MFEDTKKTRLGKPCVDTEFIACNSRDRGFDAFVLEHPASWHEPETASRCVATQTQQYFSVLVLYYQINGNKRCMFDNAGKDLLWQQRVFHPRGRFFARRRFSDQAAHSAGQGVSLPDDAGNPVRCCMFRDDQVRISRSTNLLFFSRNTSKSAAAGRLYSAHS